MHETTLTKKLCLLFTATLLVTLALNLIPTPAARAATIAVSNTTDAVANDGECTLREAIVAANTDAPSGDAAGECDGGSGDDTIDLTAISGAINLTGALPDITSNIVFDGPGASNLTVRRDSGGDYGIFYITSTVTISGLAIMDGLVAGGFGGGIYNEGALTLNGSTVGGSSADFGGGIYNYGALTLTHSAVISNSANAWGGGIYSLRPLTLNDSIVSSNTADEGGGIYTMHTLTLNSSAVISNQATSRGGGIFNYWSYAVELNNSTISDNNADGEGGGIYNAGILTLNGSVVDGNSAEQGGGIDNEFGTVELTDSTVSGNQAASGGGGLFNDPNSQAALTDSTINDNQAIGGGSFAAEGGGLYNQGALELSNVTVSNNEARDSGGGIYNGGGGNIAALTNSSVISNSATHGGGIVNDGGAMELTHSTISGNEAVGGAGGGIRNFDGAVSFKNSLIAGNIAVTTGTSDCHNAATLTSLDYNLVGDNRGCSFGQPNDQLNVAPLLSPLQDNGGPTETRALRKGSPAIDAIPTASCNDPQGAPIAADQRGVPRPQGASAACDVGAYEAQNADLSLRKAVNRVNPSEGETVVFSVQTINNGPLGATGVVISDQLPLGLTFVSFDASQGSYSGGTGAWNVGNLATDLSATLTLSATVDGGTVGTTITNIAAVMAVEQVDSYTSNDRDMVSFIVAETPISGLTATNDSPTTLGQATTLTATIMAGSNANYTWNLGDGATSVGAAAAHTYPAVGVYTAIVTASNGVSVRTATMTVTVTDVPISGLVAINDGPTPPGQATTLTATITAGSNVSYTWNLGDGSLVSGMVVTHTYPIAAVYTATVTASNGVGIYTATTTVAILALAPTIRFVYLPLTMSDYAPPTHFPLHVGDAIPQRAVVHQGEVFYTWSGRVPDALPPDGRFYFSSQQDTVAEVMVDDAMFVLLDGVKVFDYSFSVGSDFPRSAIVEVPRSTMEGLVGQTITIEYRDVFGVIVGATEMWLIWTP